VCSSDLGAWTATALPFCVALVLFGPRWMRVLMAGVPLLVIALLASGNRGSLVGAVVGVVVVVVLATFARSASGPRFAKVAAFGIAAVLVGALIFPVVVGNNPAKSARYANIAHPARDASFNGRLVKWRAALNDSGRYPFGHGIGSASPGGRRGRFQAPAADNVDSAYVQVAFEQGIVVMVLLVVALFVLLAGLIRRSVATPNPDRAVLAIAASGTLAAFMVICVSGQFQYDLVAAGTWVMVGVGLAPFTRLNGPGTGV